MWLLPDFHFSGQRLYRPLGEGSSLPTTLPIAKSVYQIEHWLANCQYRGNLRPPILWVAMLARFATTTLLLLLLSAHLAIGRDSEQFRDFSHKGSAYVPLENSKTYDSQPMTSNILALKLPTFSENHFPQSTC